MSALTVQRLLSSTVEENANLCVYDANHNGDSMTVTILCPLTVGCCEKSCCKMASAQLAANASTTRIQDVAEQLLLANQTSDVVILVALTVLVFVFGSLSVLFIYKKVQQVREAESQPDFEYHAYRQKARPPKVSSASPQPSIVLTDYRIL